MVATQSNFGKKYKITVELITKTVYAKNKDCVNERRNNVEMEDFCQ